MHTANWGEKKTDEEILKLNYYTWYMQPKQFTNSPVHYTGHYVIRPAIVLVASVNTELQIILFSA